MSKTGSSRRKEDGMFDLEQQFILRMPKGPAEALRKDVEMGAMNLKDKLTIELKPDDKKGFLRYGDYVFNAKLVDLPTIIESLKTTDNKTFYKTADICQMLSCQIEDYSSDEETTVVSPKRNRDKRYAWNHGITPPLKNVKKRRFRKTLRKKYQQEPDIEKEVKRLFRMDNEAIDVRWEVVQADEVTVSNADPNLMSIPGMNDETAQDFSMLGEQELYGDLALSSDEDDDDDETDTKDTNLTDIGLLSTDVKREIG